MNDDQLMGILNKFDPNGEYPSYYHESNVLSAMREAMRLESIGFHKWAAENSFKITGSGKYRLLEKHDSRGMWFNNEKPEYTTEELYNEYLNQSK